MASSFPGGLDSFTNPTSGDDLDTSVGGRTHSQMHRDENDALEAVQAELGTDPAGAYSTVKARLTALDRNVFDAVAYGALVDGSTNDTAAWQAAIDACATAGGGVVTSSKNGVSVISGALQDTGGANAQLLMPAIDAVDTEQISITLAGTTQPPTVVSVIGATTAPDNHLVLKSTLASGTGAVIGAQGPVGTYNGFTNVHLRVENLTVRTVSNPTITGLDLRQVASVDLDAVIVDCGAYYVGGLAEPTSTGSYGIRLPKNNNGAHVRLGMVDVIGFYTGYEFAEHATGVMVSAWGCKVAAEFDACNHASVFLRFMSVWCERGVKFTGAHAVDIWQFDIEHASSGWYTTDYDIDDASNYGKGFFRWWVVLSGTGPDNTFTVNSATGITTSKVGAAIGSGGSSGISVQDENGTAITGVTQLDFQGAGVTATSGTGEVVVTIPGGTGYVYRDRLVAVTNDSVLTLGAAPVANSPLVWVNGTIKWPTTDYTVSSNVLTFNSILTAADVVAVQYHSAASSASASTLTGAAVNILDNFTRADSTTTMGTTSTGAKAWTGTAGTWGISTNKGYLASAPSGGIGLATVNAAVADGTVSSVLSTGFPGSIGGLAFRVTDANNCYVVEVTVGAAYAPKIYKIAGGSVTTLATGSSITFASGDTLSVVLSGTSLTVKRNGTTIVSTTDSTYTTQTKHGYYSYWAGAGTPADLRFDDFSVQP